MTGNPIDPMVGWYDRMVAEGDETKLKMLRNIPALVGYEIEEPIDIKKHKEYCITHGYGTRETMNVLFPEPELPNLQE